MPRKDFLTIPSAVSALFSSHTRTTFLTLAIGALAALGSWHWAVVSRADTTTAVSLTTIGTAATENFNTLVSTATGTLAANTPGGWGFVETGTGANTTYTAGTGSSNAGDTYSFGATSNTERAFGGLQSGTVVPTIGGRFVNNTGATINSLLISYNGEQWRLGTTARAIPDKLDFQYSLNATSLTIGTWTDVDTLDFSGPFTVGTVGALDGNAAANRTAVSATISSLSIASGAEFFIRWNSFDATGSDDGLAVDDFSITPMSASATPIVTITATDAAASETGPDAGTFRITRTGATTSALNISYSIAGTSTAAAADYTPALTGTTTIPSGSAFVDLTITPVDDGFVEGSETLTLNLTDTVDYDLGSPATATVTIADNDSPPTLSINDVSITEGNAGASLLTFTVMSSSPAPGGGFDGFIFTASTMNGTATTADNDYVAIVNAPGSIAPGSSSTTIAVTINGDTTVEANEAFSVVLTKDPQDSSFTFLDDTGVGTINNDDVAITPIHDIQGSGNISPLSGSIITEGIVTGVRSNGFYIQAPVAEYDANAATSEGIFVFGTPVSAAAVVGNRVRVTGTISEFIPSTGSTADICSNTLLRPSCVPEISVTELTAPTVTQLSTGNALPPAITLSSPLVNGSITQLERYEFMRVKIDVLTVVAPTGGFKSEANATSTSDGVFQGIITTVAQPRPEFNIANRPYREAGLESPEPVPPGSGAAIPPIPRFDGNPERIRVDSDALGQPVLDVTSGATVSNLQGVLDYGFRTYTLFLDGTLTPSVTGNASAIPLPDPAAGQFYVGSFNLERFYDTVDDAGVSDVALTATAFANRLNKASLAIRNVLKSPDILGIVEMENLTTLQALAAKINADAVAASQPNPNYVARLMEGNDIGGIDVGFLLKTAIVFGTTPRVSITEVVQEGAATTFVDPTDMSVDILNDRPPLRFTGFVNNADGRTFPITVIVNHLRSLNGVNDPTASGTSNAGARVRFKRQKQAEFLANLVQARQVANPNERIALVGDFNAFKVNDGYANLMDVIRGVPTPDNEDVVPSAADLVNPNFINLINDYPGSLSYTYVFGGNAQAIDHILTNDKLNAFFTQFFVGHLDADFPEIYRTDATRPERISDHDAPIACFDFDPLPDISLTKTHTGNFTIGTTGQYNLTVSNGVEAGPTFNPITLTDNLPGNLTLNSFSGTGWSCTGIGTATANCMHAGPLNAGASLPLLTLTVNVGTGTPTGTNSVTNNARALTQGEEEPNLGDNEAFDPATVSAAPCPTITVTNPIVTTGMAGAAFNQTFTQAGGNGTVTFSTVSALPTGLTLSSAGVLSGTPTVTGTFPIVVKATDSNNCMGTGATYTLVISCQTITVTNPATATGTAGTAFSQTFTQAGGIGTTTFSTASALPTGITLSAAGLLAGTPTQAGSFPLVVKATDGNNCMGTANYTLTINKANTTTVVVSSLNPSQVGQSVTFTATVSPVAPATGTPTGTLQFKDNGSALGAPVTLAAARSATEGATAFETLANSTAAVTTSALTLGSHTITAEYGGDAPLNGSTGSMVQTVNAASVNANLDIAPSDQKPGSILFYNYYTSTVDAARQNTRISITNTHVTSSAYVHLFFVDGSSCTVADSYICLTANQTASFLASDLDPGTTGYIVAVATDRNGCPLEFNFLIGDEYVKLSSGHQANLGAEAIAAVAGGLPACDGTTSLVELRFNNASYNPLPRTLALSNFGSPADGNNTLLVVNRIGGNLATGAASIGSLFGLLYDDAEKSYSFGLTSSGCQLRGTLSGTFPRTTPRIESIVGSGRSGWLRLSSSTDGGIFGVAINFNSNAASNTGAFTQGHNLHKLTLSAATTLTIPVFPPTC